MITAGFPPVREPTVDDRTGSIAAYKAVELLRQLLKAEQDVHRFTVRGRWQASEGRISD